MARLSSHFLNGTDGTHAGDVRVSLWRIGKDHVRELIFESQSEADGRFAEEVNADADAEYEMVVDSGAYFRNHAQQQEGQQICDQIVSLYTWD